MRDLDFSKENITGGWGIVKDFWGDGLREKVLKLSAVFVLDKMADMVIILMDRVNNFMLASVIQPVSLFRRVRPYLGCKFSLEEAHGVRMNYLYRDEPLPCGW